MAKTTGFTASYSGNWTKADGSGWDQLGKMKIIMFF